MVEVKERPMLSERVRNLRQSLVETRPNLSCERLHYLRESYEETEGQPTVIRRAKCFEKYLEGMTIFIDENPIVGTLTRYRAGVQPFPEWSCKWMLKDADISSSLGEVQISEEDRQLLKEAEQYWLDKCLTTKVKEIWREKYGDKIDRDELLRIEVWNNVIGIPLGRLNLDFGKVLNKGLKGVIEEAREEMEKIPIHNLEGVKKRDFLKAVIISCDAVIAWAHRYADLAEEMAGKEVNPERKRELEGIAEACRWVPANPVRNFREAIQSFWFIHCSSQIHHCSSGYSPGRVSQYMYPFYKKDKEEGRISEDEAIEQLELLFIKFTEIGMHAARRTFEDTQGTMFQNISLGGVTPDGEDATNEMDFLLLEAQKRVRMFQPTLSVLYHDKLSDEFLLKAAEVVRTGIGMPAFFNNDVSIQRLLYQGASLEDARNLCIIGCVEGGFSHTGGIMWGGFFNITKLLELALNNGRDPRTGKQAGPTTGEAESFKTYEELEEAVKKQLEYHMALFLESEFLAFSLNAELLPVPFLSALTDDCIKNGKDMWEGGARYSMHGCGPVGTVDLGDSLMAIKKLVFEEKRITMKELLKAMEANFEGYEEIRRMLLEAPKYGNDDDQVDQIVKRFYDLNRQEHEKFNDHLGRKIRPFALSVTAHFPFGRVVGALPSGRKAWLPLTDGTVSPEPGQDKNGPTALIRSATKVIDTIRYASNLLNMKFHPSALESVEGLKKLIALMKTYMDLSGHHVQFNVVSTDTLRDAQLHPENYQDLIVRVAGFSALFIHLDPVVQEEIIKRTELSFGG